MQRTTNFAEFQAPDFNPENLDDATLQSLIEKAKHSINEMTQKVDTTLPSGDVVRMSPLELAQSQKDQQTLDSFYQRAESHYRRTTDNKIDTTYIDEYRYGRTILFWAIACFQSEAVITSLIEQKSNPIDEIYRDDDLEPFTPIFYAMSIGNTGAVKAILQHNPNLMMQEDQFGKTPVHYAAESRKFDMLEILLQYNSKAARIRTSPELTPLHTAVEAGDDDVVTWLLENDDHSDEEPSLSNIGDINQVTPLHLAIIHERPSTVAILLDHGANHSLATGRHAKPADRTPLQMAADAGNNEVTCLLMAHGARPDTGATRLHPVNASQLSPNLQIVFAVLDYMNRRERMPKHTRTFLGITNVGISNIVNYKIVYSRQDKMNACNQLINNIINGDEDPLKNLTTDQLGALSQGELREIVMPLILEHERLTQRVSPICSPSTSPSPRNSNH